MRPRYQVFIASPYIGLEEARSAVIDGVLRLNWHPTGMEFFPAIAGSSWEWIQNLIRESDYFVVLLGGRAGTWYPDTEVPITEMEYNYALAQNIPIARFVHANPTALPDIARETDPTRQCVFERFRKKLREFPFQCGMWSTREQLIAQVLATLTELSHTAPATWLGTRRLRWHGRVFRENWHLADISDARQSPR